MKNINTKKGFTIIEVVLVLAIAGLIFLMVFVALPNLQKSQRDTRRRNDIAAVATAITQYQSNNGGNLPGKGDDKIGDFANKYIESKTDPSGSNYKIKMYDRITDSITNVSGAISKTSQAPIVMTKPTEATDTQCTGTKADGDTVTSSFVDGVCEPAYDDPTNTNGNFDSTIYIITNASCGEDGELSAGDGARSYAVAMRLEGSGYYCTDN